MYVLFLTGGFGYSQKKHRNHDEHNKLNSWLHFFKLLRRQIFVALHTLHSANKKRCKILTVAENVSDAGFAPTTDQQKSSCLSLWLIGLAGNDEAPSMSSRFLSFTHVLLALHLYRSSEAFRLYVNNFMNFFVRCSTAL